MSLFANLADLTLRIDRYALSGSVLRVKGGWDRHTTIVRLEGGGRSGVGEDVTYHSGDQLAFQRGGELLPLAGRYSLGEFSDRLGALNLFEDQPSDDDSRDYRRWAFEAAALDLALSQNEASLHEILNVEPHPVRFVVSMSLPDPPSIDPIPSFLQHDPGMRFKVDVSRTWTDETILRLAETDAVDVVDLKGAYRGTAVDQPPDADLYRRVAAGLGRAWIEDPALNGETSAALDRYRGRITWDAPIHSVADIEALPFVPRTLNMKPSRFGSLKDLLDAYDYCRARGVEMYGGGQFELGPGRIQVQYLASLFHAGAPNDVAPVVYHDTPPRAGLPRSPLKLDPARTGFARIEGGAEATPATKESR